VDLSLLGWNLSLQSSIESLGSDLTPARVAAVHRGAFALAGHPSVDRAELVGRVQNDPDPLAHPAVGDWVAVDPGGRIAGVLPRTSQLVRRAAGRAHAAQVVAANMDLVLVVTAIEDDFNPRRLERYLAVAWDSGASPAVVLTKCDLDDPAAVLAVVADLAPGVPAVATSAALGLGLDDLCALIGAGRTAVLVGSSGVGKSSLVNALLGEERQKTLPVRDADRRGRHATTHRELFELPGGGLLIDTPGMRLLGIFDDAKARGRREAPLSGVSPAPVQKSGMDTAFADIDQLAAGCRFRSCAHAGEPGCAVTGAVDSERLAGWRKLQRELAHAERKLDRSAARAEKERWKSVHRRMRERKRIDPKLDG
jgi:ribosome biogenesis GTPase